MSTKPRNRVLSMQWSLLVDMTNSMKYLMKGVCGPPNQANRVPRVSVMCRGNGSTKLSMIFLGNLLAVNQVKRPSGMCPFRSHVRGPRNDERTRRDENQFPGLSEIELAKSSILSINRSCSRTKTGKSDGIMCSASFDMPCGCLFDGANASCQ